MSGDPQTVLDKPQGVLTDARMSMLILYVRDMVESRGFYEHKLGLRVVEVDERSVRYDAGPAQVCLVRASDHGITLPAEHDDASDVVFLTDDAHGARDALQRRGVTFERERTYGVGTVIDFYDPNGHRLMLYEPSEHAMTTPAEDTIRSVWREYGRGGAGVIGAAARPDADTGLDGKPLIYCFVFVKDIGDARWFYEDALGLYALHRSHCCNDNCPDDEPGVVKYEGGGVMLSSHHLHGHEAVLDDHGKAYGARDYEPELAKGVAPVFEVPNVGSAAARLAEQGLRARDGVAHLADGPMVGFDSPSGHLLYLTEPASSN